jgi:cytochrome c
MRILVAAAAVFAAATIAHPASAAGDIARGGMTFTARCAQCHSPMRGGPNRVGPNLFGIVGRKAATHPGYSYSPAMRKSGIVWTEAALRTYLRNPPRTVPGGKMAFAGLADPAAMDDLIAYLSSLK